MKKKVVHILPAFYTQNQYAFDSISSIGGAERFAAKLALSMSTHCETTLLTFGESDFEFKEENLNIKIVQCKPFLPRINGKVNFICPKIIGILKNFDVIHTYQYSTDTTLLAVIASKIFHKRLFITDLGWRGLNISRHFPMKYFCTKMLGLTDYDKERYKLCSERFEAIYGGVDIRKYTYQKNKERKVMFIGRLLPHKGVNYLIDALNSNTKCVIAGHAYDKKYLKLLKRLAAKRNVKFLLSASDKDIYKHLRESSVLVLPSVDIDVYGKKHRHPELFGLVIAEAFACGTPVIVSNSSALPHVVNNNSTGMIVEQNRSDQIQEKINMLLNNPKTIEEMGANARNTAENLYNWDKVAEKCIDNYFRSTNG